MTVYRTLRLARDEFDVAGGAISKRNHHLLQFPLGYGHDTLLFLFSSFEETLRAMDQHRRRRRQEPRRSRRCTRQTGRCRFMIRNHIFRDREAFFTLPLPWSFTSQPFLFFFLFLCSVTDSVDSVIWSSDVWNCSFGVVRSPHRNAQRGISVLYFGNRSHGAFYALLFLHCQSFRVSFVLTFGF